MSVGLADILTEPGIEASIDLGGAMLINRNSAPEPGPEAGATRFAMEDNRRSDRTGVDFDDAMVVNKRRPAVEADEEMFIDEMSVEGGVEGGVVDGASGGVQTREFRNNVGCSDILRPVLIPGLGMETVNKSHPPLLRRS